VRSHPSSTPVAWASLGAGALVILTGALNNGLAAYGSVVALVVILVAGVLSLSSAWHPVIATPGPAVVGLVLTAVGALTGTLLVSKAEIDHPVLRVVFVAGLALGAGLVVYLPTGPTRIARLVTGGYVVAASGLTAVTIAMTDHRVDVSMFLNDGSAALLRGENPYAITFPNIYPPDETLRYYGPGVVQGDRLMYGFPYLPGLLLGAVPGHLLGDTRYIAVLGLAALAVVIGCRTPDLQGRFVAVLLTASPVMVYVVLGSWTEPMQVALLGFAVVALRYRRLLLGAVLIGVLLVTKQYLVVTLPALWLLREVFSRREWVALAVSALAVCVPFFVTDPGAFWHSVVEWQVNQPFRPDSTSLLVLSVNELGWPPPAVYAVLPVGAGLMVAALLAWRLRPGPAAFLLTMGLAVMVTVLLSKQAFVNYYSFVGGCLLLAAWVARDRDPQFRSPSLPREVAEVGDVRREPRVHA
jgi:hypothetical protein